VASSWEGGSDLRAEQNAERILLAEEVLCPQEGVCSME
jgi:hypothetical protein